MSTLYYKNAAGNDWAEPGNWFTDPEATTSAGTILPNTAPWLADNVFKTYNLAFATGVTVSPRIGYESNSASIGNGFDITGTCSIPVIFGYPYQDNDGYSYVYGGNYSAAVTGFIVTIYGGTFQSTVTSSNETYINAGTFQGEVSAVTDSIVAIQGGTFNGAVTVSNRFGGPSASGGTFNSGFTQASGNVTGGTFNGAFTQTFGNVTGGTFNGTYTRVAGNVTGGTFNNGIINQFYRNGFPPPLVFSGYNPNALDVLGTGLV
jgi:hypothetical protein